MTTREIWKIMKIINGIDGNCYVCAGRVARELAQEFPEHWYFIEQCYQKEYGMSFESHAVEWG